MRNHTDCALLDRPSLLSSSHRPRTTHRRGGDGHRVNNAEKPRVGTLLKFNLMKINDHIGHAFIFRWVASASSHSQSVPLVVWSQCWLLKSISGPSSVSLDLLNIKPGSQWRQGRVALCYDDHHAAVVDLQDDANLTTRPIGYGNTMERNGEELPRARRR